MRDRETERESRMSMRNLCLEFLWLERQRDRETVRRELTWQLNAVINYFPALSHSTLPIVLDIADHQLSNHASSH